MKADTQHLEFLISQYVDGTLDAPNRKLIEHELAHNDTARDLLKSHRDVQEVLDDFGSRIPMIDWNAFDTQLAARLDDAAATPETPAHTLRRWARPFAAAAMLMMAAGIGYSWHLWSAAPTGVATPTAADPAPTFINAIPTTTVVVDTPAHGPSSRQVGVAERPATNEGTTAVTILGPGQTTPTQDPNTRTANTTPPPGSVTAGGPALTPPEGLR